MAGELGLQGLAIPEEYGGSGFGYVELGIVFEEAGRALLGGPYFATVALAAEALLRCDDERRARDLLPGIASGETRGHAGAHRGRAAAGTSRASGSPPPTTAGRLAADRREDVRPRRTPRRPAPGRRPHPAGHQPVRGRDADAPGLTRTPLPTLDQTRKQARVEFTEIPARLLGRRGRGLAGARAHPRHRGRTAGRRAGRGAAAALDAAVDYAKIRVQYGRPIGSFQGIKHKCADMLIDIESARSAAYDGLWALDAGDETEIALAAALAQAFCSEAFTRVAGDSIQVHGGIGFTWEHPAHLYLKRAKSSEVLLGTPSYHRERSPPGSASELP